MRKIALLLLFALPGLAMASERIVEENFEVRNDVRLDLECHKGQVNIETGDVTAIQMKARIYPDEGPVEDLELVEIKTSHGDRWVSIEVRYDTDRMERNRREKSGLMSSWEGGSLPFVDFDIVVPRGANLDLESHKSNFDVQAPSGEIRISSHKGRGKISGVRNDFELETHKGDFEVEIEEMRDLDIETHKGHVEVLAHGAKDFRLRGESHKGNLKFDGYDIEVRRGDDRERWVDETIGSGEHLVTLDTHKGTIRLDFRN